MICIFVLICIALLLNCNKIVVNNAEGKVFSDIDSIKYNKVGLLLGTTPQARLTRFTNYFFIYRLDAAEQLYKAGKIGKILISGDENSLDGINEPVCMRDSLVARGGHAEAIILDGKGYNFLKIQTKQTKMPKSSIVFFLIMPKFSITTFYKMPKISTDKHLEMPKFSVCSFRRLPSAEGGVGA